MAVFVASIAFGGAWLGYWLHSRHEQARVAYAVHRFCGECHRLPEPDILPSDAWDATVRQMYDIAQADRRVSALAPAVESAVAYYERRAPASLAPLARTQTPASIGEGFVRHALHYAAGEHTPQVANVRFVPREKQFELLICEGGIDLVLAAQLGAELEAPKVIANVSTPCRVTPVDLDHDGLDDYLVASIGDFSPADVRKGSVVWLRRHPQGGFRVVPLMEGLGRVADVQAADFDADGDLDLVVAVFGWRNVGQVLYLENATSDWSNPQFEPTIVDGRPGAVAVPVVDLNGDGRPDFIAALAQQFEAAVAYANRPGAYFQNFTLFAAGHPAWGFSSIDAVDFDRDGDWDFLVTNGDTQDDFRLKPYHGVGWLENQGAMNFTYHPIGALPAAYCAKAGDLDGDGDFDVVASAFYSPQKAADLPRLESLDSVVWLEQSAPGTFVRHAIEKGTLLHPTLDLADYDGDGDPDVAVGVWAGGAYGLPDRKPDAMVTIFENRLRPEREANK